LLTDEISLSSAGNVVHEVLFATGARWIIESADLTHSTTIAPVSEP